MALIIVCWQEIICLSIMLTKKNNVNLMTYFSCVFVEPSFNKPLSMHEMGRKSEYKMNESHSNSVGKI